LRLNHNYIGTEHLLLGLVREENGVAVKVLRELGVEPVQIIRAVERTVGQRRTSTLWETDIGTRAPSE
jgi:ATP-dependent Clp protease ATP-binding subunit ClpC